MEEQNKSLTIIQNAELDILKQVAEICSKYKIDYFIVCGTLLGAVRHGGFIPWDDDVDIAIPRPQYCSFIEAAKKELADPFGIQVFDGSCKKKQNYFAKITNAKVQVREVKSDYNTCLPSWLDVFPLDGAPENNLKTRLWRKKCTILYKLFTVSQLKYKYKRELRTTKSSSTKEILMRLFLVMRLDCLLNSRLIWEILDKNLKKYDYCNAPYAINHCSVWRAKELFPKGYYDKGIKILFSGVLVQAPKEYDKILKQLYGDYMVLPPKEKRNRHSIEII